MAERLSRAIVDLVRGWKSDVAVVDAVRGALVSRAQLVERRAAVTPGGHIRAAAHAIGVDLLRQILASHQLPGELDEQDGEEQQQQQVSLHCLCQLCYCFVLFTIASTLSELYINKTQPIKHPQIIDCDPLSVISKSHSHRDTTLNKATGFN